MKPKPPSYSGHPHGLIKQDEDCQECFLGKTRNRHNIEMSLDDKKSNQKPEYCVGGAGPEDLSKVRLIVISDFPGHYEAQQGHPMVDMREHREERKRGLLNPLNAGALLRMSLELMYGLDTYNELWISNAIKCNPGKEKPNENKHLKPCVLKWLSAEINILNQHCPTAPILVAGPQAFKGLMLLYKQEADILTQYGLNGCRRRKGLKLGRHPAIFTFNPATAARSMPKFEDEVTTLHGKLTIKSNQWLYPPLPGSPLDRFIRDLHLLQPYV